MGPSSSDSPGTLSPAQERAAVAVLTIAGFVIAVNVNLVGALGAFVLEDPIYAALSESDARGRLKDLLWTTGAAAAVSSLMLGPVVDRIGRRDPIVVGSLLFTLAMAGHWFVEGHESLLTLRVLSGFGGGLVFTGASAAIADMVPYERRAASMGVFSLGLFLAIPLGLPLGNLVARTGDQGWRLAFAWLTVPSLLAVPGLLWCVPRSLGRSGHRVTQLAVLRERHVLPCLLSVMLYTGAFFTSVQFAATWLDETALVVKERQPLLWVMLGLSSSAGALLLPRIADRVGKRRVVLLTTGAVAVCLLLLARVDSLLGLWLVGIPLTLIAAARTPALQAMVSELVDPRMRGTVMGLRAAAVNIGAAVFSFGLGSVYAGNGFEAMLHVAAVVMVGAYLLIRFFVKVNL